MTVVVLISCGLLVWCLAPLVAAVGVGRAFRDGETDDLDRWVSSRDHAA